MKNLDIKKQGVYAIRNKINGKVYIGSTDVSFLKRWNNHKKRLRHNEHHSTHLLAAWNKYGEDNFIFLILEITSGNHKLREGYYIKLYKSLNSKYGYNEAEVDDNGISHLSEKTKKKLSIICKLLWKEGKHSNNSKKGKPSWNKGIKCNNISESRRKMFSSILIYKDNLLIVTFRSIADLEEYTREHEIPGLLYYNDKANRLNKGVKTTHLLGTNIHRAIRNNSIYRGLIFKKSLPLSPEMGIVKWENCWKGEIPNQQPSISLTTNEGSETNS